MKQDKFKFPKDMTSAKKICTELVKIICKDFSFKTKLKISFDDKYKNFGHGYNQCAYCGDHIQCAEFYDWNYDLLVFAVLHELGHHAIAEYTKCVKEEKLPKECMDKYNGFSNEYSAWKWAIDRHIEYFNQNISMKQSRYMLKCLSSYLIDFNSPIANIKNKAYIEEKSAPFWCPIKKKVLK